MTASDPQLYKRSLDININLCWGIVLLIFGALMLIMAWRGRNQGDAPNSTDHK